MITRRNFIAVSSIGLSLTSVAIASIALLINWAVHDRLNHQECTWRVKIAERILNRPEDYICKEPLWTGKKSS